MSLWKTLQSELDHRHPLPPLHPSDLWDVELSEEILGATDTKLMGVEHPSPEQVHATKAGLLLWNDDLDAAHTLVQDLHTREGSYWHAILHRREGDYANAKYWFARVGNHPIFESLYQQASRLWPMCKDWGRWSPDAFVNAVEQTVNQGEPPDAHTEAMRRVQVVEFSFLLRHGLSLDGQ